MTLDLFNLEGKLAVVTGACTGLGQGMVLGLAEAGADVVGVDIGDMSETKAMVTALGRNFTEIKANLMDFDEIDRVFNEIEEKIGVADILVNNAGIIRRADAIEFTEKDWDDVMDINIKAVFFMSQRFAKSIIAKGKFGKITNIASMLSFQGGIRVPSYTASKSGVMGVTRLMANEWASKGITINAIAPGYMATNNTEALRADEKRNADILDRIPANRWGTPSDLKGAVVFLSSNASDYVNGYTLAVDGGWLAR